MLARGPFIAVNADSLFRLDRVQHEIRPERRRAAARPRALCNGLAGLVQHHVGEPARAGPELDIDAVLPCDLDERVDGRIIDDVVAEWACRHGRPFALRLPGPIGRHYEQGSDGVQIEADAVEFCRILSGRAAGDGLLGVRVLF